MDGKDIVIELNEYYFDSAYEEQELPVFEYYSDGDISGVYFGGILIVQWDETPSNIVDICKKEFDRVISVIFQASADAICKEMDK